MEGDDDNYYFLGPAVLIYIQSDQSFDYRLPTLTKLGQEQTGQVEPGIFSSSDQLLLNMYGVTSTYPTERPYT